MEWEPRPGVHFRLIDTLHGCIVVDPLTSDYAALSYVWGGVRQTRLDSESSECLSQPGSLFKAPFWPSKTVAEAIDVCQAIGIRFLWVDALCIMQDDTRDKTIQILRMRRVFESARITIIAADGDHANAGLYPDNPSRRLESLTERVCEGSVWNTRGWTFQEGKLAHRKLIFTSTRIYFGCQSHLLRIQAATDVPYIGVSPDLKEDTLTRAIRSSENQLSVYFQSVSEYSARDLTWHSDVINAFQGILQSFESSLDGQPNRFHYGLPTSSFDQAFCWQTFDHAPYLRRPEYPSWSWLGWQQAVFWHAQHRLTSPNQRSSQMLYIHTPKEEWEIIHALDPGVLSHH